MMLNMWNQRLLLLYPQCTPFHLDTLRTWLLRYVRKSVRRNLRKYLCLTFGTDWSGCLVADRGTSRGRTSSLGQQGGILTFQSRQLSMEGQWVLKLYVATQMPHGGNG
jgi:hypothetical protein